MTERSILSSFVPRAYLRPIVHLPAPLVEARSVACWPSFITGAQMNPRDAALINDAVRFVLASGSQPNRRSRFSSHRERERFTLSKANRILENFRPVISPAFDSDRSIFTLSSQIDRSAHTLKNPVARST